MDVMLVGGTSPLMKKISLKLHKEGHRIFILTDEPKSGRPTRKVFETYHFSYEESCIREVVESIQPDETIFLGAFDTNYKWAELKSHAGAFSAGLMNVLSAFVGCSTGRFIYLSSEEVFQQEFADAISEDETPAAVTAKGQALAVGEGICKYYRDMGKDVVTLRLDHMYGMPESALEAKTNIQKQAEGEIAKFTNEIKRYPRLSKNDLYSYADRYHVPHSKAESIARKYIKLI